jgi:hypothetical protein
VKCTLVHYGELWSTYQKVHQTTWEDVSVGFLHSDVSATPTFCRLMFVPSDQLREVVAAEILNRLGSGSKH